MKIKLFLSIVLTILVSTCAFAFTIDVANGGKIVHNNLHQLALIFSDNRIIGALATVLVGGILFGGIASVWQSKMGGKPLNLATWLFVATFGGVVAKGVFVDMKQDINIYDTVTNKNFIVADVPYGIAVLFKMLNSIEFGLLDMWNTASSDPILDYTKNANLVGFDLLYKANQMGTGLLGNEYGHVAKNVESYYEKCVIPEWQRPGGTITDADIKKGVTHNVLEWLIKAKSHARYTTIYTATNAYGTDYTCAEAYDLLATMLSEAAAYNGGFQQACESRGYEAAELLTCKNKMADSLAFISKNTITDITAFGRQQVVANAIWKKANESGDTLAQALLHQSVQTKGQGILMASNEYMPQIRYYMSSIVAALTIIVVLLMPTPLFPRIFGMFLFLWSYITIWGIADAFSHKIVVDQTLAVMQSLKLGSGIDRFQLFAEEAQKALAVAGMMSSATAMIAGFITTMLFRQGGNMMAALSTKIGGMVGNEGASAMQSAHTPAGLESTAKSVLMPTASLAAANVDRSFLEKGSAAGTAMSAAVNAGKVDHAGGLNNVIEESTYAGKREYAEMKGKNRAADVTGLGSIEEAARFRAGTDTLTQANLSAETGGDFKGIAQANATQTLVNSDSTNRTESAVGRKAMTDAKVLHETSSAEQAKTTINGGTAEETGKKLGDAKALSGDVPMLNLYDREGSDYFVSLHNSSFEGKLAQFGLGQEMKRDAFRHATGDKDATILDANRQGSVALAEPGGSRTLQMSGGKIVGQSFSGVLTENHANALNKRLALQGLEKRVKAGDEIEYSVGANNELGYVGARTGLHRTESDAMLDKKDTEIRSGTSETISQHRFDGQTTPDYATVYKNKVTGEEIRDVFPKGLAVSGNLSTGGGQAVGVTAAGETAVMSGRIWRDDTGAVQFEPLQRQTFAENTERKGSESNSEVKELRGRSIDDSLNIANPLQNFNKKGFMEQVIAEYKNGNAGVVDDFANSVASGLHRQYGVADKTSSMASIDGKLTFGTPLSAIAGTSVSTTTMLQAQTANIHDKNIDMNKSELSSIMRKSINAGESADQLRERVGGFIDSKMLGDHEKNTKSFYYGKPEDRAGEKRPLVPVPLHKQINDNFTKGNFATPSKPQTAPSFKDVYNGYKKVNNGSKGVLKKIDEGVGVSALVNTFSTPTPTPTPTPTQPSTQPSTPTQPQAPNAQPTAPTHGDEQGQHKKVSSAPSSRQPQQHASADTGIMSDASGNGYGVAPSASTPQQRAEQERLNTIMNGVMPPDKQQPQSAGTPTPVQTTQIQPSEVKNLFDNAMSNAQQGQSSPAPAPQVAQPTVPTQPAQAPVAPMSNAQQGQTMQSASPIVPDKMDKYLESQNAIMPQRPDFGGNSTPIVIPSEWQSGGGNKGGGNGNGKGSTQVKI